MGLWQFSSDRYVASAVIRYTSRADVNSILLFTVIFFVFYLQMYSSKLFNA